MKFFKKLSQKLDMLTFKSSTTYWVKRYKKGGNSGLGSYGQLAQYKADILNQFVSAEDINTVIEFGCGDGNQLTLEIYPNYIGFDVSPHAIELCQKKFTDDHSKRFYLVSEYNKHKADLTLSLDVIYHLVEDDVFENHMRLLFNASNKYVILYSSNTEARSISGPHVRHRKFTNWIEENLQGWHLIQHIPNPHVDTHNSTEHSSAEFFIYEKMQVPATPQADRKTL